MVTHTSICHLVVYARYPFEFFYARLSFLQAKLVIEPLLNQQLSQDNHFISPSSLFLQGEARSRGNKACYWAIAAYIFTLIFLGGAIYYWKFLKEDEIPKPFQDDVSRAVETIPSSSPP